MGRLTTEERMVIQACLTKNMTLTEIARRLKRDKSTISREIAKNTIKVYGVDYVECIHYKENFLCNSCRYRHRNCYHTKYYYDFKKADDKAKKQRHESCKGSRLKISDVKYIDSILIEEIRNLRQSLHHVYIANPALQKICSERTIRRLIYRGEVSVKPHELRRYVRYKHSSKTNEKLPLKDITVIIGRTYTDYLSFVEKHKRLNIVQYDSVIGKVDDDKAILTITFKKYNFQFGLLIKKSDQNDVQRKIKQLFRRLGNNVVKEIFPINIADNGIEFSRFNEIEIGLYGEKVCRTFFTTPYRSNDKSECERNHELIRYFIPKGISMNKLTQEQVNYMFSNINSYVRKSKGDKTPYDIVLRKFGKAFLDSIGITKVEKKKVDLNRIL